jgi:putative membrane protein
LLVILTLPITVVTLGLFLVIINAIVISLASAVIPGFSVDSFAWAIAFSIVLSLINSVFNRWLKNT